MFGLITERSLSQGTYYPTGNRGFHTRHEEDNWEIAYWPDWKQDDILEIVVNQQTSMVRFEHLRLQEKHEQSFESFTKKEMLVVTSMLAGSCVKIL